MFLDLTMILSCGKADTSTLEQHQTFEELISPDVKILEKSTFETSIKFFRGTRQHSLTHEARARNDDGNTVPE